MDTNWWQMGDYTINWSYFEKSMRTPYVIMRKSAISDHSRYNILSNELVRRLSNMNREGTSQDEKNEVVENFILQCKTSGYSRHETREGVVSGIKGWKRKHERRARDGISFYRGAKSTLAGRVKKKLTEKTSWYKKKRKRGDEEEPHGENKSKGISDREETESPRKKRRKEKRDEEKPTSKEKKQDVDLEALMPGEKKEKEDQSAIAVMFVPYTEGAELAKRVRKYEAAEKEISGWFFKIVERGGDSLVDLIHRSDPWSGEDCRRDHCKSCWTKMKTNKNKTQDCSKRNCIYETWCMSCWDRDTKEIEEKSEEKEEEIKRMMKNRKAFKYIGETSRSIYERTWEHTNSMKQLQPSSHMLKHILEEHGEEEIENVEFGARVMRFAKTAFDRQVMESVLIQEEREQHHILNSKSEYNRCSLPRLTAKLGENEWKKKMKEGEDEKEKEKRLERRILEMRKERNNPRRGTPRESEQPPTKKRKTGAEEWKGVRQQGEDAKKRKEGGEEQSRQPEKRRKIDIREYMMKKGEEKRVGGEDDTIESPEEREEVHKEGEDAEEEREENSQDQNGTQDGVRWGEWEKGEWMEEDFWDKYIAERTKKLEEEERKRQERIEKAKREEKCWELARVTRDFIEECKTNSWIKNKEMRVEKEKAEREKRERMEKIKRKKIEIESKKKQQTLLDMMKKLPHKEREVIEIEERKFKKLELQEMKTNLWRKWRGRKVEQEEGEMENDYERKMRKIETTLQKMEEEKETQEERKREWQKRRRKMMEEGREKQAIAEKKAREKRERIEKKSQLEKKWEMLRWITNYIDSQKDRWDEEAREVRSSRRTESLTDWEKKSREEKITTLSDEEKWRKTRELQRTPVPPEKTVNGLSLAVEEGVSTTIVNDNTAEMSSEESDLAAEEGVSTTSVSDNTAEMSLEECDKMQSLAAEKTVYGLSLAAEEGVSTTIVSDSTAEMSLEQSELAAEEGVPTASVSDNTA